MVGFEAKIQLWIVGILTVVILLVVGTNMIPQGQIAGNALNSSTSIPMASLLVGSGVLWVLAVLGIFLLSMGFFLGNNRR